MADDPPTASDIAHFITMFERLDRYEASNRHTRGYGAFAIGEIPDPIVIRVMDWLKEQSR